jgi:hypothetical protein
MNSSIDVSSGSDEIERRNEVKPGLVGDVGGAICENIKTCSVYQEGNDDDACMMVY